MKKKLQKDLKSRKLFTQQELSHIILKSIVKNENFFLIVKWNAMLQLADFPKGENKIRFVNRCILSNGKAKFNRIFKKFSRLSFLSIARSGQISGLKKSSW